MTLIELAHQAGLKPKWVASTNGGEYHSECPICGGKDRFWIQPAYLNKKCMGRYACRQCGIKGDSIEFAIKFAHYSFKESLDMLSGNHTLFMPESSFIKVRRQHNFRDIRVPSEIWMTQANYFYGEYEGTEIGDSLYDHEVEFFKKRKIPWPYFMCNHIERIITDGSWGTDKPIWIPKGIIIPTVEKGQIVRLKIRQFDPKDRSKRYVIVSGSGNREYWIGDIHEANHFIIMESELDAYLFHKINIPLLFPIAMGSALINPTKELHEVLSKAETILICHDNDKAGLAMKYKWRNLYPKSVAYPTPIGKDIGEAIELGLDIKEWLKPVWSSYGQ